MFKKTLLVLACSAILTACGGGGDSSSNNGGNNPNPAIPASDLDKAKQLVDTTNTIISYFDSFDGLQSQYQPTFDAISDAGSDIGNASSLILTLASFKVGIIIYEKFNKHTLLQPIIIAYVILLSLIIYFNIII